MKELNVLFCLLVGLFFVGGVSAACLDGTVGYWGLDDNLGDMIGENDGVNNGGVFAGGQVREGMSFDGASYVTIPDESDFDISDEISISAWVNFDVLGAYSTLVAKRETMAGSYNYVLRTSISGNEFDFYYSDGSANVYRTSGAGINVGELYNVVVIHDFGDASSTRIYLNNILLNGNWVVGTGNTAPLLNNQLVTFGGLSNGEFLNGTLDEVAIYDRVLTPGEVGEIHQKGSDSLGLCECNSSDDIIMKLFSPTNSHGALWNDTNYFYDICYSDYFGAYSGEMSSAHDCDEGMVPNNKIVGLWDISNSHAEAPNLDAYENVCYGDIFCVARDSCEAGEEVVLSLYSDDNSHLAEGDVAGYDRKICCSGGGVSVLEWRDMMGNVITEANVGNTVRAVKRNAWSGVFNIFEEDDGIMGFLLGGDDEIRSIDGVIVGSDVVADWMITEADMLETSDYDDFRFDVDGGSEVSGVLSINQTESDDDMVVTVNSPNCADIFDEGDAVTINVSAVSSTDLIEGTVTLAGSVFPFTNGGLSFDYPFGAPGNYQVVVSAVNSRGKRSRTISSIIVLDVDEDGDYVDGDYVAACISEPKNFMDIEDYVVPFDASTTRGVKVVDGDKTVFTPEANPTSFSWYWKFFMPGDVIIREPFVKSDNIMAYKFAVDFPVAGQNSASLRVVFE